MENVKLGKWGAASLGLIVMGLWAGFGCSSDPAPDGGTGGNGTGGNGTGGNGTGGNGTGGNGTGGGYACNEELHGTGGAIYLPNCDEWLGEREGNALDFSCGEGGNGGQGGQGGQGGAAADAPALERVCRAPSDPQFLNTHPVYFCLEALTDSVCSSSHEADVVACLTQEPPCNEDLGAIGCTSILAGCSALDEGTCYWAMNAAGDPDYIETCFAEPVSGETCDARFMRCAWDL